MNNATKIALLQRRISILKTRGEMERKGLINKMMREIRALQKEEDK